MLLRWPDPDSLDELAGELDEEFRRDCDAWYFGEAAGGMFLTNAAKEIYIQMMNMIAEAAFEDGKSKEDSPLTPAELEALSQVASTLRHQLAEDVGAANPPRLRWTRPGPTPEPPLSVERRDQASGNQSSNSVPLASRMQNEEETGAT